MSEEKLATAGYGLFGAKIIGYATVALIAVNTLINIKDGDYDSARLNGIATGALYYMIKD
jgi:hypothetical protein